MEKGLYLVINVSILASSGVIPTVMFQGFAESSFNGLSVDGLHSLGETIPQFNGWSRSAFQSGPQK